MSHQPKPPARSLAQPPDRHGFRGVPPPLGFDLSDLTDDTLLTELEVAALLRISTNTLALWRRPKKGRPQDHPLQWEVIGGRLVRYRAAAVRAFAATGKLRARGRPFKSSPPSPTAPESNIQAAE